MVAFLLKIAVALLVVLVNELVRVALYALTDFERHSSQTTRLTSLVTKLSNAQIVNTALLALAINASLLGGSHPASCGGDDFERC